MRQWVLVIPVVAAVSLAAQPPDTSLKSLLAASTTYLINYQKQLSYLLADELTTQRVYNQSGRETEHRSTRGEFFITHAARNWTSVHDVSEVDGRPVENREELRLLLEREPLPSLGRRLIARNASFNIGSITRNFNEPTLGLLVLDPVRRGEFKFERAAGPRASAVPLATLTFKETARPTLVRGVNGRDVVATGSIWVEPGTGRIHRTSLAFENGPILARQTTTFAHDPNVDVWVPVTFEERYERSTAPGELIVCETTYSNYRRFQVNIRIR